MTFDIALVVFPSWCWIDLGVDFRFFLPVYVYKFHPWKILGSSSYAFTLLFHSPLKWLSIFLFWKLCTDISIFLTIFLDFVSVSTQTSHIWFCKPWKFDIHIFYLGICWIFPVTTYRKISVAVLVLFSDHCFLFLHFCIPIFWFFRLAFLHPWSHYCIEFVKLQMNIYKFVNMSFSISMFCLSFQQILY